MLSDTEGTMKKNTEVQSMDVANRPISLAHAVRQARAREPESDSAGHHDFAGFIQEAPLAGSGPTFINSTAV